MQVAQEILRQLGGNKFLAITGSHTPVADSKNNTLRLTLKPNKVKAKYLKIKLNGNDTYTMTFFSVGKDFRIITKKEFEGIYCDQLVELFEETTGLFAYM